jgi:N-acetylglucosamine kinase-like BadF-type ATPase
VKEFLIGLDGGGTQTRAAIAELNGTVLGRGSAGACNLAAVPLDEALLAGRTAATEALREASVDPADVRAVCAGVAGTSFEARRLGFAAGLQSAFPNAKIIVVPDYAIALSGATEGGPGIIVIAGTGSAAYGKNAMGESHRTGAYGYLIDDAGSGYGVGRAALNAILRAADGTGEATTLSLRIPDALKVTSLTEIVPGVYGGGISRVVIASLSRVVAEAALQDSDAAASAILMRAGGALAQLAHGITGRLFADANLPFPVSPIGGLWSAGNVLIDVFTRSLRRFAPNAIFQPPVGAPVEGAVLWAGKMLSEAL